jgi:dCMP deaminase
MSRISRDRMFIEMARVVAMRGTCDRARVGAILVADNRVVSIGYNGAPSGEPHCDEVGHHIFEGHCIRTKHAETNCIDWAIKYWDIGFEPLTLYCTHFPCNNCLKHILEHSNYILIRRIVFVEPYRKAEVDTEVLIELEERGILLEQYTGNIWVYSP